MQAKLEFRKSLSRKEFDEIIKKSKNPAYKYATKKELDELYVAFADLIKIANGENI